ncbi:DUF7660 family protein [Priestia koreensis]|uniref:DUF7660 family protein n=1 Tax=Priestia koreensis TaxID=284581 RepID=UPI0034592A8C
MKFDEIEAKVHSKEDLLQFIKLLKVNYLENEQEWENTSIDTFLDGMEAWTNDTDLLTEEDTWSTFAKILYAGSRYE